MKIDYSKVNKKDIEKLLLDKNMNIAAADALFEFCFETGKAPLKKEKYPQIAAEFMNLDLKEEEDRYFFKSRIEPSFKELDTKDYDDNFYRKNIVPKEFKDKDYQLAYLTFSPYQCFPYDDVSMNKDYVEVSRIGYFNKPFSYLAVMKNDVVWMSTDPNEINTMKQPVSEAKGRVLAFGLGLGYFPIMAALKEDVTSVSVVELDEQIISIFKKHILPLFPQKDKIHIIHGDAFEYAKRDLNKEYDYLFIDIWHNPEDGLPMYLKLYRNLHKQNIKVSYWLEKSILAMYRRCLLTIIEENMMGFGRSNYTRSKNEYDKIINDLNFKTESIKLSSIDEIKGILQDNYLKKLI